MKETPVSNVERSFIFEAICDGKRTGSRGVEIIPHREFFMNLPGNCANASVMVCHWCRLKTGRGRYQSAYEEL